MRSSNYSIGPESIFRFHLLSSAHIDEVDFPKIIHNRILGLNITIYDIFFMKMLNCQTKFSCIESCLFFWKCHLSCQMKTKISTGTVVKSKIEIVRSLKGKMEVDDELMICLLQDISLNNSIFKLFLKNKIFLLKSLESIKFIIGYKSS